MWRSSVFCKNKATPLHFDIKYSAQAGGICPGRFCALTDLYIDSKFIYIRKTEDS